MKTTSPATHERRTKIVCTIGPATSTSEKIVNLIQAGMDVARLNFSHGSLEDHSRVIAALRTAARQTGKHIGILQDLPGPKDRTGSLKSGPVTLKTGQNFILTT
ncbi:MAG: pyruvate kinase, partial [Dehalococcoidales bacterium]|nr:pyruvate kinase [Dehalococcoidales bacterium]